MTTQALKVSIFLPGRYGKLDSNARYQQIMQLCPSCGSKLLPLYEKLREAIPDEIEAPGGPDGAKTSDSGGWFCSQCGLHIMPGEQTQLTSAVEKMLFPDGAEKINDETSEANTDSLTRDKHLSLSHMGKVFDDEYQSWEEKIQQEFKEFINSVREHFHLKEKNLQEYQIDLCQREKDLQNSEEEYHQRMSMLKDSEEEMRKRMSSARDSVTAQLQNRIDAYKSGLREVAVQTQDTMYKNTLTSPLQVSDVYHDSQKQTFSDEKFSGSYIRSPLGIGGVIQKSPLEISPNDRSSTFDYQNNDSRYSYSTQKVPGQSPARVIAEQEAKPYTHAMNLSSQSSRHESPEPHDRSSSRSSGVAPQTARVVTSPGPKSMTTSTSEVKASYHRSGSEYRQFERTRLGNPPPPPGSLLYDHATRSNKRSSSSEMLEAYQERVRMQSPSPERPGERSHSADVLDSPRNRKFSDQATALRSRSTEGLLDDKVMGSRQKIDFPSNTQPIKSRLPGPGQRTPTRREAPPYNGPPAYSRTVQSENLKQNATPPSHSRESSINGQGESAMIESRTIDVQVARSKAVIGGSGIPSPTQKAVKFGVAVLPSSPVEQHTYPKTPHPKQLQHNPTSDDVEPDMTSTPREEKEIVFPMNDSMNDTYHSQQSAVFYSKPADDSITSPKQRVDQIPTRRIPGYSPSKPIHDQSKWSSQRKKNNQPSVDRMPTQSRVVSSQQQSQKMNASKIQSPPSQHSRPYSQQQFGLRQPIYRNQAKKDGNKRGNGNAIPMQKTQTDTRGYHENGLNGIGQDVVVKQAASQLGGKGNPYHREMLNNLPKQNKEINNNRPNSYLEDEVFVEEPRTTVFQSSIPAGNPTHASRLQQPATRPHELRSKSDVISNRQQNKYPANQSRSVPTYRGNQPVNGRRAMPVPGSYNSQRPEPQQPVPNRNQNQNNFADQSNLADESMSSVMSNTKDRYFDFSPTYKGMYQKYHSEDSLKRYSARKEAEKVEHDKHSPKSPSWRSRTRLPNYGKYITEIQEIPVPTDILDK